MILKEWITFVHFGHAEETKELCTGRLIMTMETHKLLKTGPFGQKHLTIIPLKGSLTVSWTTWTAVTIHPAQNGFF